MNDGQRRGESLTASDFLVARWLRKMLDARELAEPDGRPLYRYKLSLPEVQSLKPLLQQCFKTSIGGAPRAIGAAFCLWTAHWFQQEFDGGRWSWAGPSEPVGAPADDWQSIQCLVAEGMKYLRRDIRKIGRNREYLASLVVEGGFPSQLITQERNWLTDYVQTVTLAASQGDDTLEAAIEHADFYQRKIPTSFRAASLCHLTADLAHHVVGIRRRLADAGISVGAVEWLDSTDPEWRSELPIATNDASARLLVEGLVRASARKTVLPVSCSRIVKRDKHGRWSFGLLMDIDGKIDDADLPSEVQQKLSAYNRARLLPAGALAKIGLPAVAVADKISDEDWRGWETRSLLKAKPTIVNEFPLDEDVRLVFSTDDATGIEFVPKGGVRLTSDVLVFRADSAADEQEVPSTLTLLGSGSLKDREKRLYLAVRAKAQVTPSEGAGIEYIGAISEWKLFAIEGSVSVTVGRDTYRIQSGADQSDSASIEAIGHGLGGANARFPIYRGCPIFFVHRNALRKKGDHKSLRMRISGRGDQWAPFDASKLSFGLIDIAAVDEKGAVFDRLTFADLPKSSEIRVSVPSKGTCIIETRGLEAVSVQPLDIADERVRVSISLSGEPQFTVTSLGARNTNLSLRWRWPASEIVLEVPVLTDKLAFYDKEGNPIPPHANLTVAGLRGASIETVNQAEVLISVREHGKSDRILTVDRNFERTLPFSQIRDDIERLFAMTDDLDAEVRVEALHGGFQVATIHVRRFDVALKPDEHDEVTLTEPSRKQLLTEHAEEIEVFGRPFADLTNADRELDASTYESGLHWSVPEGEGP